MRLSTASAGRECDLDRTRRRIAALASGRPRPRPAPRRAPAPPRAVSRDEARRLIGCARAPLEKTVAAVTMRIEPQHRSGVERDAARAKLGGRIVRVQNRSVRKKASTIASFSSGSTLASRVHQAPARLDQFRRPAANARLFRAEFDNQRFADSAISDRDCGARCRNRCMAHRRARGRSCPAEPLDVIVASSGDPHRMHVLTVRSARVAASNWRAGAAKRRKRRGAPVSA